MSSSGQEAVELAASAGVFLDPWQQLTLQVSLAEAPGGGWQVFETAVIVARQNGKGEIALARQLFGLFLAGTRRQVHTAHEFKALDCSTPMLTGAGWSTMGELREGDEVLAPDGTLTKVLAAHPVRHGRPCFTVRLDDGQELVADAEHLWEVFDVDTGASRTLTTAQLLAGGVSKRHVRTGRDRCTYRWRIALPAPLAGDELELEVDPWQLGAWLGDGTTLKGELTVGRQDLDYVTSRLDALGETYRVRGDRRWPERVFSVTVAGLAARLRRLGVLGAKHVPDSYFLASTAQRTELVRGLWDTDGTLSAHQVALTLTNARLADDAIALVRGLGVKASLREYRASLNGQDAGAMYRVQFSFRSSLQPFGLPRKAERMRPVHQQRTRAHYNAVVAIEEVATRPTRCITVAHESACYLAGRGMTVTHNTAADAFSRICEVIESTPDLDRKVAKISGSHGDEGITLLSGAELRFFARTGRSGRGFAGDIVYLDEGFHVPETVTRALVPILLTRKDAQLWWMSSAVDQAEHEHGKALAKVRRRALAGGDPRLAYLEWSADEERYRLRSGAVDFVRAAEDPRALAEANPSLNQPRENAPTSQGFADSRGAMSAQGFAVEHLGIGDWPVDEDDVELVIAERDWAAHGVDPGGKDAVMRDPVVLAIDTQPGLRRPRTSIGAAGRTATGRPQVELLDNHDGTDWVVPRLLALIARHDPAALLIDGSSPANQFIEPLARAGIEVVQTGAREMAQAFGLFLADASATGDLLHLNDPALLQALRAATTRNIGDAKGWDRRNSTDDISPLVSVTLARLGLESHGVVRAPAATPQRIPLPTGAGYSGGDVMSVGF